MIVDKDGKFVIIHDNETYDKILIEGDKITGNEHMTLKKGTVIYPGAHIFKIEDTDKKEIKFYQPSQELESKNLWECEIPLSDEILFSPDEENICVRNERNFTFKLKKDITSGSNSRDDQGKLRGIRIDGTVYGLHKKPKGFFISNHHFMA
jgi:hypothetical protein